MTPTEVLKLINDYWRYGDAPLSPYARLTDEQISIQDLIWEVLEERGEHERP